MLARCAAEDKAIRRNAVNRIRNLIYLRKLNIQEKAISENQEDDEWSLIEKKFFLLTNDDKKQEYFEEKENLSNMLYSNSKKSILLKLNYRTAKYYDIVERDRVLKIEPPYISSLSDMEVLDIFKSPLTVPK